MSRSFFYVMDQASTIDQKATRGGARHPNKGSLQAYIQDFSIEAIDALVEIMRTSRNESLKMGAAKALLDKTLPDVKAMEVTGQNGEPIKLNIISGADYVSALGKSLTASTAGTTYGSTEVQGTDLAQTGTQDNNSNQSVSKVEST